MASFLSDSLKNQIRSLNNDLHDTFAKSITVYKNSQQVYVATSPQYNSLYSRVGNGSQPNVTNTIISETFNARIYYTKSDEEFLSANPNIDSAGSNRIIIPMGSIKIVVPSGAKDFLKEARQVEFDGCRFSIESDGEPIGLMHDQFYRFFLIPLDE